MIHSFHEAIKKRLYDSEALFCTPYTPSMLRNLHILFWLSLSALPFAFLLIAIAIYGVNVPFDDELYALSPLMENLLLKGDVSLWDFYGQLNDHRPIVPVLALALLAWATSWNAHTELLISPLLALVTGGLIYHLSLRTLPKTASGAQGPLLFLTSLLLFSLTQWDNWSQGISSAFLFTTMFGVASIVVLSRRPLEPKTVILAAFLSFLASFSHAEGLLLWLALLPLLIFRAREQGPSYLRKTILFWGASIIVTFLLYLTNYEPVGPTLANAMNALESPFPFLLYALSIIGSPFFHLFSPFAAPAGAATIAMFLIVTLHSRRKAGAAEVLPWCCLFLYALLFALLFAMGRNATPDALQEGHSSRVISSALLATVATLYLACLAWHGERKYTIVSVALFLFVFVTSIFGSLRGLREWQQRSLNLREGKACLEDVETAPVTCLKKLTYNREEFAEMAREAGWIVREIQEQ
jgi:hypothetical protein